MKYLLLSLIAIAMCCTTALAVQFDRTSDLNVTYLVAQEGVAPLPVPMPEKVQVQRGVTVEVLSPPVVILPDKPTSGAMTADYYAHYRRLHRWRHVERTVIYNTR